MKEGFKKVLTYGDLWELPKSYEITHLWEQFETHWNNELERKKYPFYYSDEIQILTLAFVAGGFFLVTDKPNKFLA